jgi:hypothetical protein
MANRRYLYWDWVRIEAARINSDGCTLVSECFHDCCLQHDLAYKWGKDPYAAYKLYCAGMLNYWEKAPAITRAQADADFRLCIQRKSPLGVWSVMSWVRWIGVRVGGGRYWRHDAGR